MVHCAVCGTESFEENEGLYFCSECGTQSQDIRSEELEMGEVEGRLQSVREIRTVKETKQTGSQLRTAFLEKGRDVSIFEVYQTILKMQCDALIRLGFSPVVKGAVKLLWFQYLHYCGYISGSLHTTSGNTHTKHAHKTRTSSRKRKLSEPAPRVVAAKRRKLGHTPEPATDGGHLPPDGGHLPPVGGHLFSDDDHLLPDEDYLPPDGGHLIPDDAHLLDDEYEDLDHQEGCDLRSPVPQLSIKITLALCYLGLLYAEQNALPTDMIEWASTNLLPFYDLPTLLPRHLTCCKPHLMKGLITAPLTTNVLANVVAALYRALPLPALPAPNTKWVCHSLVDKLKLHDLFHRMVDRFLDHVYCCRSPHMFGVVHKAPSGAQRVDVECMAAIVFLLRLVYRLDDSYEVHYRSMNVSDNYLRFCRQVFENTRTPPIPGSRLSHHCWVYQPFKFRSQISELFRASVEDVPARSQQHTDALPTASELRLVPVDFGHPSPIQLLSTCSYPGVLLNQLPHSLRFLLEVGADLLEVGVGELYEAVVSLEQGLAKWPFREGRGAHFGTTVLESFETAVQFSKTLLNSPVVLEDSDLPDTPSSFMDCAEPSSP